MTSISIKVATLTLLGACLAFGANAEPLAEAIEDIRSLGWAPTGAEKSLLSRLPRPPRLNEEERKNQCNPSRPDFADSKARDIWTRRPLGRTLTVWGVAHFGARAASKSDGILCQDFGFLAKQWQAAVGSKPDGSLTLDQVTLFSQAVSDVEWGRESNFTNKVLGLGTSREVQRIAAQAPPTNQAVPAVVTPSGLAVTSQAALESASRLAQRKNCISCHQATFRMIGPSLDSLATKHASDPTAVEVLVRSLAQGSKSSCKFIDGSPLRFQRTATEAELREIIEWMIAAKR